MSQSDCNTRCWMITFSVEDFSHQFLPIYMYLISAVSPGVTQDDRMSFLMYLSKTIMNHKFTSTNWYFLIYDSLDWNLVTYIKCRECTAWRHTKDKNWFASDWNDDMSLDETLHVIAVLIFLHRKWQNLDGNMADTTLFTFSCLSFLYEYYFTKMF